MLHHLGTLGDPPRYPHHPGTRRGSGRELGVGKIILLHIEPVGIVSDTFSVRYGRLITNLFSDSGGSGQHSRIRIDNGGSEVEVVVSG